MDFTDLETPCIPFPLPSLRCPLLDTDATDTIDDQFLPNVKVKQEFESEDDEESEISEVVEKKFDPGQLKQQAGVVVSKMNLRARAGPRTNSVVVETNVTTLKRKKTKQKEIRVRSERSRRSRSASSAQNETRRKKRIKSTSASHSSETKSKRKPMTLTSAALNSSDIDTTASKIKDLLSKFCESNCKICDELILKLSQHFTSDHQQSDAEAEADSNLDVDPIPSPMEVPHDDDLDLDLHLPDPDPEPEQKLPTKPTNRRYSGARRLRCRVCFKKFSYQLTYDEHVKTHAKFDPPLTLTSAPENDDLKMKIQDEIMNKALELVGKNTNATAVATAEPVPVPIPSGSKVKSKFSCTICPPSGTYFLKAETLAKHYRDVHDPNRLKFTCVECGGQFYSAKGLGLHFKSEHPAKTLEFDCSMPNCQAKKFSSMFALKTHIAATHFGKEFAAEKLKPFPCEDSMCDQRFASKITLQTHMRKYHPPGAGCRYTCKICAKIYKNRHALRLHVLRHDDKTKPVKTRRHMCEECGKLFETPDKLKRHKMSHSGERPHICDQCGKSFAQKGNLNDHYKIHTGERPFKCEICGKGCILAGNLKKHMQIHKK